MTTTKWGITYNVDGQQIWMSVPFENPYLSVYEYDSKEEAEKALAEMRADRGTYTPADARVAQRKT